MTAWEDARELDLRADARVALMDAYVTADELNGQISFVNSFAASSASVAPTNEAQRLALHQIGGYGDRVRRLAREALPRFRSARKQLERA